MTILDPITELAVLSAVARGMGFAYAARTTNATRAQVEECAKAAGWPDIDAVRAVVDDIKARQRRKHRASLPANAVPLERVSIAPKAAPERPDLSVARIPAIVQSGEVEAELFVEPAPAPETAELLPEPTEELYQQLMGAELEAIPEPTDSPDPAVEAPKIGGGIRALLAHHGFDVEGMTITIDDRPLLDWSTPMPEDEVARTRQQIEAALGAIPIVLAMPCEVCGVLVTAAYIRKTGRARHGWHPEES